VPKLTEKFNGFIRRLRLNTRKAVETDQFYECIDAENRILSPMQFPVAQDAALEKSSPETFYRLHASRWKGSCLRAVASSMFLDEFYLPQADEVLQEPPWNGTLPVAILALPLVLVSPMASSKSHESPHK
jgi:hypothetical protein